MNYKNDLQRFSGDHYWPIDLASHLLTVFIVGYVLNWFYFSSVYAHSLPTHMNLTKATVPYLAANQPKLECSKDDFANLTDLLLIGTVREDDWFDPQHPLKEMGRFVFHFTPKLDGHGIKTECSSLDWWNSSTEKKNCTFHMGGRSISKTNENTWIAATEFRNQKLSQNWLNGAIGNNPLLKPVKDKSTALAQSGFSQGWVKLGYVLHLFEDLSSPSHSLNVPHEHAPVQTKWKNQLVTTEKNLRQEAEKLAKKTGRKLLEKELDELQKLPTVTGGVDVGFPDPLEADIHGNESNLKVSQISKMGLIDKTPKDLFNELQSWVATNFKHHRDVGFRLDPQKYEKAHADFNKLAPKAVQYAASMLWQYAKAEPMMGSCKVKK